MRRLVLALATLSVVAVPAAAQSTDRLTREIARIEPSSGGRLGVAAMHLESGRTLNQPRANDSKSRR